MGIDINLYRCRIGRFMQPLRRTSGAGGHSGINVDIGHFDLGTACLFMMCFAQITCLLQCGDIEQNPGPPKAQPTRQCKLPFQTDPTDLVHDHDNSKSLENEDTDDEQNSQVGHPSQSGQIDVSTVLRSLNSQFAVFQAQMNIFSTTLMSVDEKLTAMTKENAEYAEKVTKLENRLATAERKLNTLRAKNFIIHGLKGNDTDQQATESQVRLFFQDHLNMSKEIAEGIEIEEAKRLKNGGKDGARPILASCLRLKDKRWILKIAAENLPRGGEYRVKPDMSPELRKTRGQLGRFLKEALKNKQQAKIRGDKLVIDLD